jgi:hypothetical protein
VCRFYLLLLQQAESVHLFAKDNQLLLRSPLLHVASKKDGLVNMWVLF